MYEKIRKLSSVKRQVLPAVCLLFALLLVACGEDADLSAAAQKNSSAYTDVKVTNEESGAESTVADSDEQNGENESGDESITAGSQAQSSEIDTDENPASESGDTFTEITFATFNIKHGAEGLENIAGVISSVSPDIIGLEEVDVGCERSGYADECAELARLAGYDYYAFSRAIRLGSGEYGTAILSRYPIESFEVIPLESGRGEARSVGHATVDVGGTELDVFVTHLSFEDREARKSQIETISTLLADHERYALLGDLNSFDLEEIYGLGGFHYVNSPDRKYDTFRRFDGFAPDNIVVSEGFTELESGVYDSEYSDHRLLFASFLMHSFIA